MNKRRRKFECDKCAFKWIACEKESSDKTEWNKSYFEWLVKDNIYTRSEPVEVPKFDNLKKEFLTAFCPQCGNIVVIEEYSDKE